MTPDEKILIGNYLGKTLKIQYFAAATTGSFRGNIKNGQVLVCEAEKIKIFPDLSKKITDPVLFEKGACFGTYSFISFFNPDLRVQTF
jgi:hypothetical protein